jgi:P pilus assembly chaperone PapD
MNHSVKLVCLRSLLLVVLSGMCQAQNFGLGLNPGKMEVEILPGTEKTISFAVESPASEVTVRGRLLLSLTDWNISEDGNLTYQDPGSRPGSSAKWIIFSPTAFNITSGQKQMVRVTVRVPAEAKPGTYRSAIFVQERPPAPLVKPGEHNVFFRFRYAFILYVMVPPVTMHGELVDARIVSSKAGMRVVCEMKNTGSRHIRPFVNWSIYDSNDSQIRSLKSKESLVVLPFSSLKQAFEMGDALPPGKYELRVTTDFQDGNPLQTIKRAFEVPPAPSPNPAPVAPKDKK